MRVLTALLLAGCTTVPARSPGPGPTTATPPTLVSGGTLRQEEISLRFQLRGIQARLFPLDDRVISLLAPDSYRAFRDLLASQRDRLSRVRMASGSDSLSVWYMLYRSMEPDARFSPGEVVIRAAGRDFRPLDILPLSAGFEQHRIAQGQTQSALYLFDAALDVNQPLEVSVEDARSGDWEAILRILERERARTRPARRDTT
jgi:hypothetical protein